MLYITIAVIAALIAVLMYFLNSRAMKAPLSRKKAALPAVLNGIIFVIGAVGIVFSYFTLKNGLKTHAFATSTGDLTADLHFYPAVFLIAAAIVVFFALGSSLLTPHVSFIRHLLILAVSCMMLVTAEFAGECVDDISGTKIGLFYCFLGIYITALLALYPFIEQLLLLFSKRFVQRTEAARARNSDAKADRKAAIKKKKELKNR